MTDRTLPHPVLFYPDVCKPAVVLKLLTVFVPTCCFVITCRNCEIAAVKPHFKVTEGYFRVGIGILVKLGDSLLLVEYAAIRPYIREVWSPDSLQV